jgi:DNA polymerase-3 subunit alpha
MKEIEKLKLVKEDVLGLKTLDTLAEWDKLMEEKGITTEWSGLDRQEHSEEMWKLLDEGFVAGIFQCETHAGKDLAERLKVRSVEDLGVLVALNRPGPSRDGIPNRYIARKEGRSEITYPHSMLEEILKPTYGLFCIAGDQRVSMADGTFRRMKDIRDGDFVHCVDDDWNVTTRACHGSVPTR